MPLLLESYGSFKGKHAYWNFHFLGLLFSSYVEAAPLSLLFCTIRSKLFHLPLRSEYETYLMFCCGAQIFFMKCECLQCVKVKEFSVWLQRRSKRIFWSSVANFQLYLCTLTTVMGWTPIYGTSNQLENHYLNILRIWTCSSMGNWTQTFYFWLWSNKYGTK